MKLLRVRKQIVLQARELIIFKIYTQRNTIKISRGVLHSFTSDKSTMTELGQSWENRRNSEFLK